MLSLKILNVFSSSKEERERTTHADKFNNDENDSWSPYLCTTLTKNSINKKEKTSLPVFYKHMMF